MARGWESKSVESQVAEFESQDSPTPKKKFTPEEAEKIRRREVLVLTQARLNSDLQSCRNRTYEEQLRRALQHIEAQLADIQS